LPFNAEHAPSRRTFVAGCSSLFAAALAMRAGALPTARRDFVYVGSISAAKAVLPDSQVGNGKGIYLFEADLETGALTYKDVTLNDANPWWIAIDPSGRFLYSANEISVRSGDTSGSLSSYAIDRTTGELSHLNTVDSGGSRPAQLSVHPSGRYVLVANFGGNTLGVFPVKGDGSLGSPTDMRHDDGTVGPKVSSSEPPGGHQANGHDHPRPHMIQADTAGKFIVSADLSLDALFVWKFDLENGVLSSSGMPPANVGAGDGPRHFAFAPGGKLLFCLQEEAGTLVSFDYDPATGGLKRRQVLSTLPEGFAGTFYSAEIVVAPSGNFLYIANRGYDAIVCFRIAKDGTLSKVEQVWAEGSWPRHLAFSPDGRFVYACNQKNDEIAVFAVDRAKGSLRFTGQFTPVGTPAILVFLPGPT
jgi:6-phosphogluconolactonase (cycloisomerase 2 family)